MVTCTAPSLLHDGNLSSFVRNQASNHFLPLALECFDHLAPSSSSSLIHVDTDIRLTVWP